MEPPPASSYHRSHNSSIAERQPQPQAQVSPARSPTSAAWEPISAQPPQPSHLRTGASSSPASAAALAAEQVKRGDADSYGCAAVQSPSSSAYSIATVACYSPTRADLHHHPIRQRLPSRIHAHSDADDDGSVIATGLRFATHHHPIARAGEEEAFALRGDPALLDIMTETEIKKGDAASYSWGGDKKGGTVTEVAKEGHVEMETARGNTVTKDAKPDDPAVRLGRAGHDVVKNASELTKEKEGESHNEGGVQKTVKAKKDEGKKADGKKGDGKKEGEAKTGEKRSADEADKDDEEEDEEAEKPKENGEEPKKKKGRPAKSAADSSKAAPKKEAAKKRAPKKAATESGEPRRSGRVAAKS